LTEKEIRAEVCTTLCIQFKLERSTVAPIMTLITLSQRCWDILWPLFLGNYHLDYGWNIWGLKQLTPTLIPEEIIYKNFVRCIDEAWSIGVSFFHSQNRYNFL